MLVIHGPARHCCLQRVPAAKAAGASHAA